jgi:hypothetical protein
MVLAAVCLPLGGCGVAAWTHRKKNQAMDFVSNPIASFKQKWEVCAAATEVLDAAGASMGAEFTVAKPGRCDGGDRMTVFASVGRGHVLKNALEVSTGQTVTVRGKANGMRIFAESITRFKIRREDELDE